MIKNHKGYRKSYSLVAGCVFAGSLVSPLAHAELSVGALAGLVNYNTTIRGDAVHGDAPGNYYQYPADVHSNNFGGGFTARYLGVFNPRFSLGVEGGYVFLAQDSTVNRADDLLPAPTWVESFRTKSVGVVLANAVAKTMLVPDLSFSVFGGPAWLNTNYIANDFFDGVVRRTSSSYEAAGDLGVETAWEFKPNWAVGMRFDYIFNTNYRPVATAGSFGDPLLVNTTARSGLTMFSATLKYIVPENTGSDYK